MKTTLSYVLVLFTFLTLGFVPNSLAQRTLPHSTVRLVYLHPNDRPVRPDKYEKLRQLIKDAQRFFADEMQRHGFGRKTFIFESDKDGEPLVHRVTGRFSEKHYISFTGHKAWEEIRDHFGVHELRYVYLIAIDLSNEGIGEGEHCGEAGVTFLPVRGGPPERRNHYVITQEKEIYGGFAVIPASGHCLQTRGVKLIIHELGHAFGLGHDFREGIHSSDYVMAYGDSTRLSKCAAEWLSVSRFFPTSPRSRNTPSEIRLISKPTYSPEGVRLRFKVADANGLHQAQLLLPEALGEVLSGCKQLSGQTSTIEFISTELTIVPYGSVMLQIIDVDGNITWATFATDIASLLPAAQIISVPDANLATVVRSELGLAHSTPITDREMKKLTSLTYSGRDLRDNQKITDLTGLEYATSLEHLYLYGHQIRDISPLEGLPNLRSLWIAGNQIKNINTLTSLSLSLKILDISQNPIARFDQLVQLSQLKRLFLWGSGISDLNVLPQLPQLEFLSLSWNQISDVSPLAGFTNLKELDLQGNRLKDTSTLFQLREGTFPPNEEVEVGEAQDDSGRTYKLLTFQSLDLKVHINPDVTVYRSLNAVQNARQPVTTTNEVIEKDTPATNVIVEDAGHPPIYWINAETGTLHRLVDTEVEGLVPRVRNANSLAVDVEGGKLYWAERTSDKTGRIRRANLDGTSVQLVKDLTSVPHGIALDPIKRKIYLANSWGKVQRLNFDGSNFQPNLITGLDTPRGLAVDVSGGKVYWTEIPGRIRRANLDGSNIQDVATGLGMPMHITVSDSIVYWTVKTGEDRGEIQFTSLHENSNVVTRNTFPQGFPVGIAVDAIEGKLYWTTSRGEIGRSNLGGGNFQPNFVTGLTAPGGITVEIKPKKILATDALLSVSPSPVTSPAIGERLTLSLNIAGGEAVVGYQVTLQFDTTALRYVESSKEGYLPDGASFAPPVVKGDRVELASTARSGMSNGDGTLATITFEVLAAKASTLTLSDPLLSDDHKNVFRPRVKAGEITEPPKPKEDVNGDGIVNIQDLVLVASGFGQTGENTADVNGDGIVNIQDLVLVAGAFGSSTAAAPTLHLQAIEGLDALEVQHLLTQAREMSLADPAYLRGIAVLEQLLALLVPKETALLSNYPNPFNPETWIPYQLEKPAAVALRIYDVNGALVRTLTLGHQPAGIYQNRSRAVYWDGRNELEESVASGIYFYTLSAGDFTATRKMLIVR